MHPGEEQRRTLTTREVAALLGISEHLVGRMAARGEVPALRCGRLWRFPTARIYREVLGIEPPTNGRSET